MNDESVLGQRERRNGYVPRGHITIGYSEGGGEAEEKVLVIQKSQTFVRDSCRGILVTVIELFILIDLSSNTSKAVIEKKNNNTD